MHRYTWKSFNLGPEYLANEHIVLIISWPLVALILLFNLQITVILSPILGIEFVVSALVNSIRPNDTDLQL